MRQFSIRTKPDQKFARKLAQRPLCKAGVRVAATGQRYCRPPSFCDPNSLGRLVSTQTNLLDTTCFAKMLAQLCCTGGRVVM